MTALGPISSFRPWGLRPTRNAMALPGQKTSDWVTGMTGALHFMGAAPELIVPYNPRAVIAVPERYKPRVGDNVRDLPRPYGCPVHPARTPTPHVKANVRSTGMSRVALRAGCPDRSRV